LSSSCLCVFVVRSFSKNKLHLSEQIEQWLARIYVHAIRCAKVDQIRRTIAIRVGVDVAEATPRFQRRRAKCHGDVVDEQRPVGDAEAQVPTDFNPDVILKEHILKRLSPMKSQVVQVKDRFDSLSDFDINASVVNENSRIDEVRLPFSFTAAQTWQNAVRLNKSHAGLRQAN